MIRTTKEVARELGLNPCSVSQMCARLSVPKLGKVYMIDDDVFATLKERRGRVGRPVVKNK